MPRITKRLVDSTEKLSSGKRTLIWDSGDGAIKGFGLLVLPSGAKSYVYDFRNSEGTKRRITIGKHGEYTPEEARQKAAMYRQEKKAGNDPLADRQHRRQAMTVGELLDAYLASEAYRSKANSTQLTDRGRIDRHLRPLLGHRKAEAITSIDVEHTFSAIKFGRTAKTLKTKPRGLARVKGGEGTARMAVQLLRSVYSWGMKSGYAKANPVSGVRTGTSGTRETILETSEEYVRLFTALDELSSSGEIRTAVAAAIKVIALTGARKNEIASLRWEHVDTARGLIVLPPSAHKTGRKTGKSRIIGLPLIAQNIISMQPRNRDSDWVFSPSKTQQGGGSMSGPISLSKSWRKIRTHANLPTGIGLHGLRHSLASHMAMGGASAAEIMTTLGHRQLSTTQRYIHWANESRQELAEKAATLVTQSHFAAQSPCEKDH